MINPAKKPPVYIWSVSRPCQDCAVQFFGQLWNRSKQCFRFKPGQSAGFLDLLLTLVVGNAKDSNDVSRSMVQRMATWNLGWFADLPMAERHCAENASPFTFQASRIWWRRSITSGAPARTMKSSKCLPSCTASSNGGAILSAPKASSSFAVVAHRVCADHVYIFYMYEEIGKDERTEMLLNLQASSNPSVFVTTPKVGGTGLSLTATHHAVITKKICVLKKQKQEFAQLARLGQNRIPHTWLLNPGPSGYDNRARDLHQLCGVAQMKVLHGLMRWPNITTLMINRILQSQDDLMKQLMEQGDVMLSDGEDAQLLSEQCNQDVPLWTFNPHNLTNWCKIVKWNGE